MLEIDRSQVIELSTSGKIFAPGFVKRCFERAGQSRINFAAPDFTQLQQFQELGAEYFSWFVVFGTPNFPGQTATAPALVDEIATREVATADRKRLLDAWERDYAEQILGGYSPHFQARQMKNLGERLDEGVHHLYYFEGRLVGHGCWVEDTHPIIRGQCLYWHQWVDRTTPREARREIHRRFFQALHDGGPPAMSGVALVNPRALKHCQKNGLSIVCLSICQLSSGET